MEIASFLLVGVIAAGALLVLVRILISITKYRGTRVITCPDNKQYAAVGIDLGKVATTAVTGGPQLTLNSCSRWPEKRNCGQECLQQITQSPDDCLVRNILDKWYVGKKCAICGKPLQERDWLQHRPALMGPQQVTLEWEDVDAAKLMEVLDTHQPLCWDCHVAETFRRERPDKVLDVKFTREDAHAQKHPPLQ